jgi:hypothetical protein
MSRYYAIHPNDGMFEGKLNNHNNVRTQATEIILKIG